VTDFVVPPEWRQFKIEELRGTVVVIGASDTGKSTLARYLFRQWCRQRVRAAYLDADSGQSTLGQPTTLALALGDAPGDDRFPPRGVHFGFFVGSTTPRGHMLPAVIGAHRLQQKALALGIRAIVVDTTGLVDPVDGGKALKQWKIELLRPSVVIALQRGGELEPILCPLRRDGWTKIVELCPSPLVLARSREARIARRREMLALYFEGASSRQISLRQMAIYDLERLAPGSLLAFQDAEGFVLGLGVVEEADRKGGTVLVRSPLCTLDGARSLRFGATRWDLARQREL